jgi:hypothetical protein
MLEETPQGYSFQDSYVGNVAAWLSQTGVAVEKLLTSKIAKIKLRQDALGSIYSGRVDIFYPPNFGCLRPRGRFSTPTGYFANQNDNPISQG